MSTNTFTPASLEAFKRTARDLQSAYGNPLQQCQDALAKAFGYPDLHALRQHLLANPKPGPFPDEVDDLGERFKLCLTLPSEVLRHLNPVRWGRIEVEDLGLTERPEVRAHMMARQRAIDDLLDGKAEREHETETSEYLRFEHNQELKEGVLRRTSKSEVVSAALNHLVDLEDRAERIQDETAAQAELTRVFEVRRQIARTQPNNPYALAGLVTSVHRSWREEMPDSAAEALWPELQRCRDLFERVVPKGFRQSIEPKLIGNGADNYPYINVLWCGACCAQQLRNTAVALAWARKGRTLNKNDNFGFRFIIDELK